ncbi:MULTISPECIES: DUF485 domain-containing protein [unclassified Exiguobacterium]|uniref:DUF485 domain-containing protein n=1 Tax=unclassified Exiguobacterium TaxID=2644629 RepID=UPI000DF79DBD|nr:MULTISPECIES: DUF485 domain-containing protein [unclassified Exiguobacterium]RDB32888.1 DUF485 domain-containing protein [Exiguobacterium sp. RIT594]HCN57647.1 DUF485 domain-containing protein [Exiguobacterium sp.]
MHQVSETAKTETTRSAQTIVESASFKQLMREKNAFILPAIVFCLIFYFTLPIMTSYFTFLNRPLLGDITGAWLFAFLQFIMTWTFCTLYNKKARSFDRLVEQIKEESR